ncbi:hypothetical protein L195_g034208 [Trifolium pratense]|uniref:Uncharacterized protein n=1 Tax=Trifolium pratense TaxID=57577 RepID=A0A2K3LI70_TRIPR|nr:hypothetical protein L195_g034208 [Trifolium pratense]
MNAPEIFRDVNLHQSEQIPARIAPFGAPKIEIFFRGNEDEAKNSPAGTSGRGSGKTHPFRGFP